MNTNEPKKYRVTLTYRSILIEHVWATSRDDAYQKAIKSETASTVDIGRSAELLESEIDEVKD